MAAPDTDDDARDRAWLAAIAAGGAGTGSATAALFKAYRARLLGWLRRRGASPELAEDLLQDVFIKVVRQAGQFSGQGSVGGWLYTITRNRWFDHCRVQRPDITLDDDGWEWVQDTVAAPAPDSGQPVDDCVRRGMARYAQSHPERAEALRRVIHDDWSVRQLAAYLQRTEAATYEYLSQCRKKLRSFLEPCLALLDHAP